MRNEFDNIRYIIKRELILLQEHHSKELSEKLINLLNAGVIDINQIKIEAEAVGGSYYGCFMSEELLIALDKFLNKIEQEKTDLIVTDTIMNILDTYCDYVSGLRDLIW